MCDWIEEWDDILTTLETVVSVPSRASGSLEEYIFCHRQQECVLLMHMRTKELILKQHCMCTRGHPHTHKKITYTKMKVSDTVDDNNQMIGRKQVST